MSSASAYQWGLFRLIFLSLRLVRMSLRLSSFGHLSVMNYTEEEIRTVSTGRNDQFIGGLRVGNIVVAWRYHATTVGGQGSI